VRSFRLLHEKELIRLRGPSFGQAQDELEPTRQQQHMKTCDDELKAFETDGAPALPDADKWGHVEHEGARIWYTVYGSGPPVILLHGGFGNGENWGHQLPALIAGGYRVVLIDSRGHGRSTRDARPLTYELMASDVLTVMDALHLEKAAVVGWSDGATTALVLAMKDPARVAGVFFFGGNMHTSGVKQISGQNPIISRIFGRHVKDYARLSATPGEFKAFAEAVELMMKTDPNYSAEDMAGIRVPVTIVQSAHDEFIMREHAEYLALSIPEAKLLVLPEVSHFAPLQRPDDFNRAMLAFLGQVLPGEFW
jgi:pimeloyl-ACP methyl ester carboxylesterase